MKLFKKKFGGGDKKDFALVLHELKEAAMKSKDKNQVLVTDKRKGGLTSTPYKQTIPITDVRTVIEETQPNLTPSRNLHPIRKSLEEVRSN